MVTLRSHSPLFTQPLLQHLSAHLASLRGSDTSTGPFCHLESLTSAKPMAPSTNPQSHLLILPPHSYCRLLRGAQNRMGWGYYKSMLTPKGPHSCLETMLFSHSDHTASKYKNCFLFVFFLPEISLCLCRCAKTCILNSESVSLMSMWWGSIKLLNLNHTALRSGNPLTSLFDLFLLFQPSPCFSGCNSTFISMALYFQL